MGVWIMNIQIKLIEETVWHVNKENLIFKIKVINVNSVFKMQFVQDTIRVYSLLVVSGNKTTTLQLCINVRYQMLVQDLNRYRNRYKGLKKN